MIAAVREGCAFCVLDPGSDVTQQLQQLRLAKPQLLLGTKAQSTWTCLEQNCRLLAPEVARSQADFALSMLHPSTCLPGAQHVGCLLVVFQDFKYIGLP